MPPKTGGGGGHRQNKRNQSLDPPTRARTTQPWIASQAGSNRLAAEPAQSGFNIAPLILEGAKLNKMELNDIIKQKFGNVKISDIQSSQTGAFTIQSSDVQSFNHLLNELSTFMISNGHEAAKVFVPRSIQRIKDTEKVAFVKRVDIEIPDNRIIEAIKSIGIDVTNIARLTGKDGKTPTRTVRITFADVANRNTFVRNGLQVDYMHFEAEPATQGTKPTQCFLCFKFNHVAKYCKTKEQICARCGENHRKDQCSATDDQVKCANCKGKHEATSQDCTYYQDQEKKMKQQIDRYSSSTRSLNTPPVFDANEFPLLQNVQRQQQDNLQKDYLEEIVKALSNKMEKLIEQTTAQLFEKLNKRIQKIEKALKIQSYSDTTTNIIETTKDNNNQDEDEFISEPSSDDEGLVQRHIRMKRMEREAAAAAAQQPQSNDVTPNQQQQQQLQASSLKRKRRNKTQARENVHPTALSRSRH